MISGNCFHNCKTTSSRKYNGWFATLFLIFGISGVLQSCNTILPPPTPTYLPAKTPTKTSTPTLTSTITLTPTNTITSTVTITPSITNTPSITLTPTFDFPDGVVLQQANCRYGPATAYLFAAGLYAGDKVEIWGRNTSGTWLWVQPETIKYQCWVAASMLDIQGDVFTVWVKSVKLPHSTLYGPVQLVYAKRSGNEVTITWEPVRMTEDDDRGYLIEANLCQNGVLTWQAVQTNIPTYTFTDEIGCNTPSSALLYVVEKHGYTDPVQVPWP
ncbi:MAG: hypothetical protein A2X25_12305 [Chloroflexi bacterium GWB2_49_20]|nr:MAG: hypothetical protein A2X25_12305 [Chloroflexi bacterium GWB2_49_20]OGN78495.1 MAG: hypothetical protein A2X26_01895 [Chloroflexi bacterium GWC2_49_37]OGN84042.1 MAG: hypothetical protein A2X27_13790 [Chloroflexi bacterium GWD2_49_16]HCC79052.1 hypothetical protein [Anaerolineae bacterium]HCM97384.1 hypothetical protein [Anaerolineae bacterium]